MPDCYLFNLRFRIKLFNSFCVKGCHPSSNSDADAINFESLFIALLSFLVSPELLSWSKKSGFLRQWHQRWMLYWPRSWPKIGIIYIYISSSSTIKKDISTTKIIVNVILWFSPNLGKAEWNTQCWVTS